MGFKDLKRDYIVNSAKKLFLANSIAEITVKDISTVTGEEDTMAKRVSDIMTKIDLSTIMFFLGILMAVAVLQEVGVLTMLGKGLDTTFEI